MSKELGKLRPFPHEAVDAYVKMQILDVLPSLVHHRKRSVNHHTTGLVIGPSFPPRTMQGVYKP